MNGRSCGFPGCTQQAELSITCVNLLRPRPDLTEYVCMPHVAQTLRELADACDKAEATSKSKLN